MPRSQSSSTEPYIRRFKLVGLPDTWQAKAARYSLSRLTDGRGIECDEKEALASMRTLIERRRKRVQELRAAGWSPTLDPTGYAFIMNCPPVGVFSDNIDVRSCKKLSWCPFCWARDYVIEAFDRLQELLIHNAHIELAPLIFWEVISQQLWPREKFNPVDVFDYVTVSKVQVLNDLPLHLGSIFMATVEPAGDDWLLQIRVLAVADVNTRPPESSTRTEEDGRRITNTVRVTAIDTNGQTLAAVVGRVLSYPTGMMTGPLTEVTQVLHDRSGLPNAPTIYRLFESFGLLRRKRTRAIRKRDECTNDAGGQESTAGAVGLSGAKRPDDECPGV